MQIAVTDNSDDLFAYLMVAVARRRGHTARQLEDLAEIRHAFASPPGAIVLGVGRLDEQATTQVQGLREAHPDSLIYLVAEDASARSTIAALEAGANDILLKPILPREVVVRAELALPARQSSDRPSGAIRVGDIEVDLDQVRAVKADHELMLTRMELRLLYCLLQHHGRVAPTERLMAFGWDSEDLATSSLKTHISHLRQKLREAGGMPVRIRARQMLGYVLELPDAA